MHCFAHSCIALLAHALHTVHSQRYRKLRKILTPQNSCHCTMPIRSRGTRDPNAWYAFAHPQPHPPPSTPMSMPAEDAAGGSAGLGKRCLFMTAMCWQWCTHKTWMPSSQPARTPPSASTGRTSGSFPSPSLPFPSLPFPSLSFPSSVTASPL